MTNEPFLQIEIQGLEKIQKFNNWTPVLEEWLGYAFTQSQGHLMGTMQEIMDQRFKNPTGALAHHFPLPFPMYSSHLPVMSGGVVNDSPYALRRNYGFSGMTDSLGRHFTSDPGIFYAEDALLEDESWIQKTFQSAVTNALGELVTASTDFNTAWSMAGAGITI